MFVSEDEMGTAIYGYQVEEIADGDETALPFAINAAEVEVRSYLTSNGKKIYQDGRPIYNAELIFKKTGAERNALILQLVKTIAKFHFIELCNADILYERAKSNYDRAIAYLKDIQSGNATISDLPLLGDDVEIDPDTGLPITTTTTTEEPLPFRMGTRKKFNHE